ncbi:beta strand repeat-containing protein [Planctomicrobium piriforme]|uniref:Cadherin domain-containing protein n=1 Tax=Planctomicrobium piriforme TaxID=1576369 RepID=A0A1I3G8E2_9PLAN|nr:FG-GAP-like repeat-containing protein [Planctomicrobium piriforme]SFI19723.1 Cadherin domain-containing protein [Planctomicrobium piriforme]
MVRSHWLNQLRSRLGFRNPLSARLQRRRSDGLATAGHVRVEQFEARTLLSGGPSVLSISRSDNTPILTSSAVFTVTFSESVTGVDQTDFQIRKTGTVLTNPNLAVSQVSGSVYTVTVNGITGTGSLGLNLVYNGSIKNAANIPVLARLSFETDAQYKVGINATAVAAADVNRDGIVDLVTSNGENFATGSVSVLIGNGDGTFQNEVRYKVGAGASDILAVDLNKDGNVDLVTSNGNSVNLSVLMGNGDGTFQPEVKYQVGSIPRSLIATDLNNDGRLDIVTSNFYISTVSVLLGNGDGTLQGRQEYDTGPSPSDLIAADVNEDGQMDIVTVGGDSISTNVSILLGNGSGTLAAPQRFAAGNSPMSVTAVDLNGDNHLDLVTANTGANDVSVLLGNGNGTFQTQLKYTLPVGLSPVSIISSDVNQDGRPDIITANTSGTNGPTGSISVLLGVGDGTFFQPYTNTDVGFNCTSVILRDVNSDGLPDYIVSNSSTTNGTVSVVLGGVIGEVRGQRTLVVGTNPTAVAVADFNGDGNADVASANTGSSNLSILISNGEGTFQLPATYALGGSSPAAIYAEDINWDGNYDLIVANSGSGTISVLIGNGNGSFRAERVYTVGTNPRSIMVSDLDKDSYFDLVIGNFGSNDVSILMGTSTGVFDPAQNFNVGAAPQSVATGDFNNDGYLDVVTANSQANTVSLLPGVGNGTFLAPLQFAVASSPYSIISRDLNNDSISDISTANIDSDTVTVMLGDGDFGFGSKTTYSVRPGPASLIARDVNGDRKFDLITAHQKDGTVGIMLGNGDGTFQPQVLFGVGAGATSVAAGDINGDGFLDFATANSAENSVSVVLANSANVFYSPIYRVEPNSIPTAMFITRQVIGENRPVGTLVGTLSTNDTNVGDILTYTLVSGSGSSGNGKFTIDKDKLRSKAVFDYEQQSSYSIRVRVTDSTGASYEQVFVINVANENDPPVISGFDGILNYAQGSPQVTLDDNAAVSDQDSANFYAGVLTFEMTKNGSAQDRFVIRNGGTGAGQIGISGNAVTYGGVIIGRFSGGTGVSPLVITLNGQANSVSVTALLRSVQFRNLNPAPPAATKIVSVTLTDGDGGTSQITSKTIKFLTGTAPPVIGAFGGTVNYPAGTSGTLVDYDSTVTDTDSSNMDGGQLTVAITGNSAPSDLLTIRNQGTGSGQIGVSGSNVTYAGIVIGTFTGGSGSTPLVVTLNTSAYPDRVQALLRNVLFSNSSSTPPNSPRTVSVSLTDGDGGASPIVTKTVTIA